MALYHRNMRRGLERCPFVERGSVENRGSCGAGESVIHVALQ